MLLLIYFNCWMILLETFDNAAVMQVETLDKVDEGII